MRYGLEKQGQEEVGLERMLMSALKSSPCVHFNFSSWATWDSSGLATPKYIDVICYGNFNGIFFKFLHNQFAYRHHTTDNSATQENSPQWQSAQAI